LFNESAAALQTSIDIFSSLHLGFGSQMKSVLTSICRTMAGHKDLSIAPGEEEKLGHALAERIIAHREALRTKSKPMLCFGAKIQDC
jgi:hypothetical protein